jgi:hypothetical protein
LNTNYTVPAIRDNNFHYTPDIRLTFTDVQSRTVGCTVTGPYSLMMANDIQSERGLVALGIACILFVAVFAILLLLSYRRNEQRMVLINSKEQTRKATFAHRKRSSMNHYQYFRTLPNGQVVSLSGLHPISQSSQQHFYKSPRPVLTATRRNNEQSKQSGAHLQPSQLETQTQHQLPEYLQNIPNDTTDDDDDDDDESEDDSRQPRSGLIISNPNYNETQLPTRPVI